MRDGFLAQMDALDAEMQRLGRNVAKAMTHAAQALIQQDYVLAEQTIDADERIDAIADHIDESAVQMLALQAPVATDLRTVVAALRLSQTLEREGDLARHIAQIARSAYPDTPTPEPLHGLICKMAEQAVNVANQQRDMLNTHDLALAARIQDQDDVLDELHVQVHRLAVDPQLALQPQQVVDAVMLGRFLERFGDHATSAARRIEFLVRGDKMSHGIS